MSHGLSAKYTDRRKEKGNGGHTTACRGKKPGPIYVSLKSTTLQKHIEEMGSCSKAHKMGLLSFRLDVSGRKQNRSGFNHNEGEISTTNRRGKK